MCFFFSFLLIINLVMLLQKRQGRRTQVAVCNCDVLELTEQKSRNGLGEPCYASVVYSPPLSSAHRISDAGVEVALRRGSQGPLRTLFIYFFLEYTRIKWKSSVPLIKRGGQTQRREDDLAEVCRADR